MRYEVERKFRVGDLAAVRQKLLSLGAVSGTQVRHRDLYFNHPQRNFAATDEALRLRQVDEENFVTYKGPKIDKTTKTRHEIELPLSAGQNAADEFAELLEALGFQPVATVHKQREPLSLRWQEHDVEAALDQVAEVGTFVELELIADSAHLDAARGAIASLATALGLDRDETRSYLELLPSRGVSSA